MKPFKLLPIWKDYIWGGNILKQKYNKYFDTNIIAETWELSSHPEGSSIICCGEHEGMTFFEFCKKFPEAIGGEYNQFSSFPMLIKLIDAKNNLSVQVHPDDAYAKLHENAYGKNEMWYILEADEDAFIYMGFKEDISLDDLKEKIVDGNIIDVLNAFKVQRGDTFYIETGTIHSIGAGIVLAEVQQNSNLTYRVFDFERKDVHGNLRPLHIDKALDVINRKKYKLSHGDCNKYSDNNYEKLELVHCTYFKVDSLHLHRLFEYQLTRDSFVFLLCVEGSCELQYDNSLQPFSIIKGDSIFIPASSEKFQLHGKAELLVVTL